MNEAILKEVRECVAKQQGESRIACAQAYRELVADGLDDTDVHRLACSLMWGKALRWALSVAKEEMAKQ